MRFTSLDYEIFKYEVVYFRIGGASYSSSAFDTEEKAVDFIKECRHKWKDYKLIKMQYAIIDF